MEIKEIPFSNCFLLQPHVIEDARGYFYESFNIERFSSLTGVNANFVQDNQSLSSYGVIRGLHTQIGEHAQAKLVRVLVGEVLDVVVDIRPDSPTYGEHYSVRLSAYNKLQLYIPRGFLHGFAVLSPVAEFFYKCDNYYNKASERGVFFDDRSLNINWEIPEKDRIVSQKDLALPYFRMILDKK